MLIVHLSKSYYLCHLPLDVVQHRADKWNGARGSPPLVGPWLPPLFQMGSSSLDSDVALIPSEPRPPAFKIGPFHTSKQRKLSTPKTLNHKVRLSSKRGMGEKGDGGWEAGRKGCWRHPAGDPRTSARRSKQGVPDGREGGRTGG